MRLTPLLVEASRMPNTQTTKEEHRGTSEQGAGAVRDVAMGPQRVVVQDAPQRGEAGGMDALVLVLGGASVPALRRLARVGQTPVSPALDDAQASSPKDTGGAAVAPQEEEGA